MCINQTDHTNLSCTPNELEIKSALFSIHPFKTLGEDGFHAIFYQKHWDNVKPQLTHEINQIFIQNSIPHKWGTTLLCLIPKIENAHRANHFRPLGLCNTFYKILSNILVNILKPLLPTLICPHQGAYLSGKHYSDLFLIAQETMHSMNNSKSIDGWMIIKIDIKKAFDSISWDFIETMLTNFNFPNTIKNLIMSCLWNVTYTPIINGKKKQNPSPLLKG